MLGVSLVAGALAFLFAFGLTPLAERIARRADVLDRPSGEAKKIHRHPIPLLGGLAIFLSITIVVLLILVNRETDLLTSGLIGYRHYAGFLLGGQYL